jgi:steroid delta-isomerase-like uncharacterized protein
MAKALDKSAEVAPSMESYNKALIQRWADEGFNANNVELANSIYDANVYYHEPSAGEVIGIAKLREFVTSWRNAFPDSHLTIEEQVANGDKVATRWTFTGTHKGVFRGIAPTGKRITMSAMYFYRFANEKIVEIHAMVNIFALLQQLGVVSLPATVNSGRK